MAVHDPQPEITPALTARQIESYLAAAQATYRAAQSHPRYRLRCIGLGAIAGGSALNLVSALVAFSDYWPNAPRWVVFWAAVMVRSFFPLLSLSLAVFPLSFFLVIFLFSKTRGGVGVVV